MGFITGATAFLSADASFLSQNLATIAQGGSVKPAAAFALDQMISVGTQFLAKASELPPGIQETLSAGLDLIRNTVDAANETKDIENEVANCVR